MPSIPERLKDSRFRFVLLKARDKIPLEAKWQETNNYPFDDPHLVEHIEYLKGNYGVLCGEKCGRLCIIDADHPEIRTIVENNLPATFTVKSAHGCHYYYFLNGAENIQTLVLKNPSDGGDNWGHVKWNGQQVVGPNSIHPSGVKYGIQSDQEIVAVDYSLIYTWLGMYAQSDRVEKAIEDERKTIRNFASSLKDPNIVDIIDTYSLRPTRTGYQGPHPVHGSKSTGMNFVINTSKNAWYCHRCERGGGPWSLIAVQEGIIQCHEAIQGALRGEVFKQVLEVARNKYGIDTGGPYHSSVPQEDAKKNGNEKYKAPHFSIIGEEIMNNFHIWTAKEDETIYTYRDGIYADGGKQNIKEWVRQREYGYKVNQTVMNEALEYIRTKTYLSRDGFNQSPLKLVLDNGIFDLETMTFGPHTPDVVVTSKLPVRYNPNADCPKFRDFLSQVLHPQDVPVMQEVFGYCLFRRQIYQKAFLFIGEGGNGKGTLLNVLYSFIGKHNVSNVSLQDMNASRFETVDMYGKMVNYCGDLSRKGIPDTGMFKQITGGDPIRGQEKFKSPFSFHCFAKLLFACNQIPRTPDDTRAFFDRWIIFNFPNSFRDSPNRDIDIESKLTTANELSGILNYAVEGLQRLREKECFSVSASADTVRDIWEKMSNPLKGFVDACVREMFDRFITKQEFYDEYLSYCNKYKLPTTGKATVDRNLRGLIKGLEDDKERIDGRLTPVWRNLVVLLEEDDKEGTAINTSSTPWPDNSGIVRRETNGNLLFDEEPPVGKLPDGVKQKCKEMNDDDWASD